MANINIPGLTALTAPATDDVIEVYDTSASENKKLAISYVALLGTANTFTAAQVINSPAAGTIGLVVNSVASATAAVQKWLYNSAERASLVLESADAYFNMADWDNGSNSGPRLIIGRNSNGATPAAGHLRITDNGNQARHIWPDNSGDLRIGTSAPTNANDTSGTVVGTQTSTLESKNILGDGVSPADALATILATPVKRFTYKSGAYNNGEFHGIIADYSPEFAMDNGRSFSPVTTAGYLIQAIKALTERIIALEAK